MTGAAPAGSTPMSFVNELVARFKAQLLSEFIIAIAGVALIVGLARVLEPNSYGLLFLALSVFGTFQLIARLGISRSAGRYIAEYREADPGQIPFIVRSSLLVNLLTICITVFALLVSYRYIAVLLGEPEIEPLLLVGTALIVFGTLMTYLEKVLQGFEAIRFVAGLEVLGQVSRVVIALGLAVGFGAVGALVGYVLSAVLASAVGFLYLSRRVRDIRDETVSVEPGLRRRIVEYAVPITATNTAKVLDSTVDTLLVGYFLSPVEVGLYVVGDRVVRFVEKPMSALGFTLSPAFGSQKAAGNIGRISRIYELTLVNSLLVYIPAAAGLVLVADPLIRLVFGPDYGGAVIVLQVLGLFIVFKAITKITDNGLDYLGRARERAIVRGVTASMNVLLNVVLIPTMGVVGAAVATVLTYGLYTAANLYIVSTEFDLRIAYLSKQVGTITGITGVMSGVVFALLGYITGWLTLLSVVGLGVAVWAALSVATGILDPQKIRSILG